MAGRHDRPERQARRQLLRNSEVAGPSPNAGTNLLIANIAMQGVAILLRRSAERGMLRGRFGKDGAHDIVKGRGIVTSMLTTAAARTATRSVPGFLAVSGALLGKAVFDRAVRRRGKAERKGDEALLDQAQDAHEKG